MPHRHTQVAIVEGEGVCGMYVNGTLKHRGRKFSMKWVNEQTLGDYVDSWWVYYAYDFLSKKRLPLKFNDVVLDP